LNHFTVPLYCAISYTPCVGRVGCLAGGKIVANGCAGQLAEPKLFDAMHGQNGYPRIAIFVSDEIAVSYVLPK